MRLYKEFTSDNNPHVEKVYLTYSALFFGHGGKWFCRMWRKNWIDNILNPISDFEESYGKTKFEAYRKTMEKIMKTKQANRTYTDLEESQPKDWDDLYNEFKNLANDIGLKDNSENFVKWAKKYFETPQVK